MTTAVPRPILPPSEQGDGGRMSASYRSNLLQRQTTRRRALAAGGATVLGAAFLAACGGGGKDSKQNISGLIIRPTDTTKQAKRTGVIKDRSYGDPPTLDIFTANNPLNPIDQHAYSTYVRTKPGYLKPAENEIGADVVDSWETAPDGLQITMK